MNKPVTFLLIVLTLQSLVPVPAGAQSWSQWKQLAEEETKNGQLDKAERSWRSAYELMSESCSKDPRLYISALELSRLLGTNKKNDEAMLVLKEVCSKEIKGDQSISDEQLACLRAYRDLCKNVQKSNECERLDSLIEAVSKRAEPVPTAQDKQVSLLFGEAAKDDLYKKFGRVKELTRLKDFAGAEQELDAALAMANATHGQDVKGAVYREQGKFYCTIRDFKRAETAYSNLAEIVKQGSGEESLQYVEILGTHARLLHLLGNEKQSQAELARCEAISNKFKITPTGQQELSMSGINQASGSIFTQGTSNSKAGSPNGKIASVNAPPPIVASAPVPPGSSSRGNGRLKIIEFYTVW